MKGTNLRIRLSLNLKEILEGVDKNQSNKISSSKRFKI